MWHYLEALANEGVELRRHLLPVVRPLRVHELAELLRTAGGWREGGRDGVSVGVRVCRAMVCEDDGSAG